MTKRATKDKKRIDPQRIEKEGCYPHNASFAQTCRIGLDVFGRRPVTYGCIREIILGTSRREAALHISFYFRPDAQILILNK